MTNEETLPMIAALRQAVVDGDARTAAATTGQALAEGVGPRRLVDEALIPAMDEAGRLFELGEFYVPELLVAARAMKASQALITPLLVGTPNATLGRVAIGTVMGDMHDIGKNLVAALLQGAGFEVIDLGADVPPARFVAAVTEQRVDIIGLSAILTTTMLQMKNTVRALEDAGVRGSVNVMVGGAPVSERFAAEVGADGYADNAAAAVALARRLMGQRKEQRKEVSGP
jgi:5-methyltetrahydrofolate--homocysteine methyltransferase